MILEYPIRVLCVMSTLDRGGAESMCMNLYRNIDREKVQFDFIKHTHSIGAFEDEIKSLGGRIFEAPRFNFYNYLKYRSWWMNHFKKHPEHIIIHGHFFSISAVYFQFAKQCGRKTVGHIHASAADSMIKELLEKRISRYTDYPIACSHQAGHWIYGNREFSVLNNALDIDRFRFSKSRYYEIRDKLGLESKFVLGTVANLTSVKNPMGLIDIFLAVKKRREQAILLWIGEGEQRKAIEDRLLAEGVADCVKLLGAREDVPDLLHAMDSFLLPSYHEGLPVSVIEAQASGLPCFISESVTRECDITGRCIFLPLDDWDKWAESIVSNSIERIDTSSQIIAAGYDINQTAKELTNWYLSLL